MHTSIYTFTRARLEQLLSWMYFVLQHDGCRLLHGIAADLLGLALDLCLSNAEGNLFPSFALELENL